MTRFNALFLFLVLSGCNLFATSAYDAAPIKGVPTSPGWFRVKHATLPIVFELPDGSGYRDMNFWSLGRPRFNDDSKCAMPKYSFRQTTPGPIALYAIEIGFFVLTADLRGINEMMLRSLRDRLDDQEFTSALVRSAFFEGIPNILISDMGPVNIDQRPARWVGVWKYLPGYGSRPVVGKNPELGKAVLVPLNSRSTLLVFSVFRGAVHEERNAMLQRIVESIQILSDSNLSARQACSPSSSMSLFSPKTLAFPRVDRVSLVQVKE